MLVITAKVQYVPDLERHEILNLGYTEEASKVFGHANERHTL